MDDILKKLALFIRGRGIPLPSTLPGLPALPEEHPRKLLYTAAQYVFDKVSIVF
jgi:hypothetical protein